MIIAICDDNTQERNHYYEKVKGLSKELELYLDVQSYSDGKQLLFEIEKNNNMPDVLILDIFMPNINGIKLANRLRSLDYEGEIIFLTKSDEYWSDAFDVHAYHYLVKNNCTDDKFNDVVKKAIQNIWDKNEDYMLFNSCGTNFAVKVKDIYYFEVMGRVVSVCYEDGKFGFYSTLSKIEEQLLNRRFIRIHKSYLVSQDHVLKITYDRVILKNNIQLPLGRKYKSTVSELFK